MSLLKSNSVQIGQSTTGTNNFTLSVPSSPDGTIKLARGNSGATTQDILSVNASGAVTLTNGGTITLGAVQNSTSGTAIDFTGIPSWVKRITVMFNEVSTNGTNQGLIQLGSGSFTTSGYTSQTVLVGATTANNSGTDGMIWFNSGSTESHIGSFVITNITGNTWVCTGLSRIAAQYISLSASKVTISGALDRVRITTAGGTDTFDAGSVNIMYEG